MSAYSDAMAERLARYRLGLEWPTLAQAGDPPAWADLERARATLAELFDAGILREPPRQVPVPAHDDAWAAWEARQVPIRPWDRLLRLAARLAARRGVLIQANDPADPRNRTRTHHADGTVTMPGWQPLHSTRYGTHPVYRLAKHYRQPPTRTKTARNDRSL